MPNLTDGEVQDLKTELDNDPDSLGYTDADGNLKSNADLGRLINERRTAYEVARSSIPMGEFYGVVDWVNEVGPLSTGMTLKLMLLTSTPSLDGSSSTVRDALVAILGADSDTVAAFDSIRLRDASRAESLFGEGADVTMENLRDARGL